MSKNQIFQGTPAPMVKKSKFDLSHNVKLTGDMGYLIPILCEDVLPGESWRVRSNLMVRFAPLLAPIMHKVDATIHYFHVPNRIMCTEFEDFITSGENGESTAETPWLQLKTALSEAWSFGDNGFKAVFGESSLWTYFGCPPIARAASNTDYVDDTRINVFPWLAYQMIWQEYYKDQNLDTNDIMQEPIPGGAVDPEFFVNNYATLRKRAWERDPATSALPWPQRGADVLLPLEGTGDVTYSARSKFVSENGASENDMTILTTKDISSNGSWTPISESFGRVENIESVEFENSAITINDFRTAVVLQRWLEANARGGNRYKESIHSHFNELVPDYRLNRPEYLGGGKTMVQISEVLSTANSLDSESNTVPQANMAGHGIAVGRSNQFTYRVREHGWIIGILSIMPKTAYQQGLPKKFFRLDRYDYAWPEFVGLGEQEMLSKEVYYDPTDATVDNDQLFGYQQRYYEYKSTQDRVAGDFCSTLDFWHMGRKFETRPQLNTDFVYASPTKRIFAVEDANVHSLWMQVYHEISAVRPIPYYSVPGLMKI